MTGFEYKVVPAPVRGLKARGIKGTPARFANALQTVMNEMGAQGWEYQRTDTLPVEERQGLTGKTTTFQNMLVFRRSIDIAHDGAPEIAALIEDQTAVLDEEPVVVAAAPERPVTAPEDASDVDAPEEQTTQDILEKSAAADRVSETLTAPPFTFPWNKRTSAAKSSNDDEPRPTAE